MYSFQDTVAALSAFWAKHNCIIATPHDVEKGAGTSNPLTLLRSLGPEPFSVAYIEPCRRPKDGRYGENPNRLQRYFQYQVILKPCPDDIVDLYLESLRAIGLDTTKHDIRFVHDDWENPTLGAWGLGWEVWIDGMEATQFTYFQAAAGIPLYPVTGEITYGIERLVMYLQGVDSIYDVKWNDTLTYGDIYKQDEIQWSIYNFEQQDDGMWMRHFIDFKKEAERLAASGLCIPAYDFVVKASHAFNMLDAKGVISVSERASYIATIRDLAKKVADGYLKFRENLGFPLLRPQQPVATPLLPDLIPAKQEKEPFVLEIGMEELPASFIPIGIQALKNSVKKLLEKERLSFSSLRSLGSPRRLAVIIEDLVTTRPGTSAEKKGPLADLMWNTDGSITDAGKGFLRSCNLPFVSRQEVEQKRSPSIKIVPLKQQQYVFATVETPATSTAEILQKSLPSLISSLEFPKSMHWGDHHLHFARPIRWILSLLGANVIPFQLEYLVSSRITYGHRQLAFRPISVSHASSYEQSLQEAFVLVDQQKREAKIISELDAIQRDLSLFPVKKEKVVPQVVHLAEWPQVTAASFSQELLDAPKEVLVSEMVEHQKYIPLINAKGELSNHFVFVADNTPSELIKKGNIKVLTARLSDGRFLWKEDLKLGLPQFREKLHTIIYQKDLGTVWQKTERLSALTQLLSTYLPQANPSYALEAAKLSKADIASQVVGEFPELQGTIGYLLASAQNYPKAVAEAIRDHWLPNHEAGDLPSTQEGSLLALADKFDTLTGFFSLGLKPSSSSDPYALRRQAIGIVRIVLSQKLHLNLRETFEKTLTLFSSSTFTSNKADIVQELITFTLARAKSHFADLGFRREDIEAVTSCQHDDLYDALLRLQALSSLIHSQTDFSAFLEVLKRCYGQVDASLTPRYYPEKLIDPAEQQLYQLLLHITSQTTSLIKQHDWTSYLQTLLLLQKPIDTLFSHVKVLADDPEVRSNRLSLLRDIMSLTSAFADIRILMG